MIFEILNNFLSLLIFGFFNCLMLWFELFCLILVFLRQHFIFLHNIVSNCLFLIFEILHVLVFGTFRMSFDHIFKSLFVLLNNLVIKEFYQMANFRFVIICLVFVDFIDLRLQSMFNRTSLTFCYFFSWTSEILFKLLAFSQHKLLKLFLFNLFFLSLSHFIGFWLFHFQQLQQCRVLIVHIWIFELDLIWLNIWKFN